MHLNCGRRVDTFFIVSLLLFLSLSLFTSVKALSIQYLSLTVNGDSMYPTIRDGDTVKVKICVNGSLIKSGDIIVYCTIATHNSNPNAMWIAHRVIEKYQKDRTWCFKTKGDNNPTLDPWEVPEYYLLGVVVEIIHVERSLASTQTPAVPATARARLWAEIVLASSSLGGLALVALLWRRKHLTPRYCVECGFYVGQYEVSLKYVYGKPVVHNEPRFSVGLCMWKGLLIKDGFRGRKCKYFEQRREGLYAPNQYVLLVQKRLRKKQLLNNILIFVVPMGGAIISALLMTVLTDLGLIPPPFELRKY